MKAGELCARQVVTCSPDAELVAAARLMRDRHVGCVIVVDANPVSSGQRVLGILTDRDIVTTVLAREVDPRSVRVDDVMTRQPVTVLESTPMPDALQRMRELGVRRIPVIKANGDLAGLLSLDDVVHHLAGEFSAIAASIDRGPRIERALRP